MGVKNGHAFMRKKQIEAGVADWQSFLATNANSKIYVDIMATFYWKINSFLCDGNRDGLVNYLLKKLNYPNVVAVFDGSRSVQKAATHKKRLNSSFDQMTKMESVLEKINNDAKKLKSHHYRKIGKFNRALFKATVQEMDYIKMKLSEAGNYLIDVGIEVLSASFEADVGIAMIKDAVVVSADSDYFFHCNIKMVVRLNVNKETVNYWNLEEVRSKLGLCHQQMTLLGVVSGNDYSENVPGI